ncbi:MAG: AAA family ATPase [Hyphomicrobiaceae bacterium]|nr:AAA family ATPase [Hyphomicrobiaceae bacterium]
MKFERLRLHGFKSFCEQTDLMLEPGLTGVVGPNGCGKSNLVEALRWVMGESSYKAMRASGMDDVIFSGSGKRPGRNSAEVTLVLDNADRSAPASLNSSDRLEVTRRIEREQGSVYRVNGREVRARDVQLLFADASTGAHSPALVRQGQIGELISAKPVRRRALLEEAAGISGLHSRRHEAELRLRAAEQNLERVDDIVAQVETQLETLRRQARLAVRYRTISADIRKAEAALFHVRWVAARSTEKETEALQGQLVGKVADAMHADRVAQQKLERSTQAQQPLRTEEAAAGAIVQRLRILREQLDEDIRRNDRRRAELTERQQQIATDLEREERLSEESLAIVTEFAEERDRLSGELAAQSATEASALASVEQAREGLGKVEALYRQATEELAQLKARRSQAERSERDAAQRAERLRQQIAEVERDMAGITSELEGDQRIAERRRELEAAHATSAEAEADTLRAEQATAGLSAQVDALGPELSAAQSALSRLESEADTLARVLNVQDGSLWPPIVDQIKVETGYETALGAALGDDLEASSDSGAPIHWSGIAASGDDPRLPEGVVPLTRFVRGAEALTRNLNQVGLVPAADGPRLMAALRPGQRLVTTDGDLWRWDGLVAKSDAPSPAAQRLAQRNRLAELDAELAQSRARLRALQARSDELKAAYASAQGTERTCREAWREAQKRIAVAQSSLDIAQKAVGDLTSRQSALEEARVRLRSSLEEAEAVRADSAAAANALDSEEVVAFKVEAVQAEVAKARDLAEQKRVALSSLEAARSMREGRIRQLETEIASWARRGDGARAQKEALSSRAALLVEELNSLASGPDAFADRVLKLDNDLAEAQLRLGAATDALAAAETEHRQLDRASRAAAEQLGALRAEMARVDERLKGIIERRQQLEQTIVEVLGISASETAQVAGIRPEAQLPNEDQLEGKVERLKAERERLGGVNLSAEQEMEEVREKLEIMQTDRDDLIAAIAKLRTGISSLNREGRQRLTEAFDKVNAHFQDLFTTLFGGGAAELAFVESDDPLEAGLEIIARPPGKKPQVLTLLSGGEQALTAMALIFAVFLTNPAPICVLDEVDAPLDDANVERFCDLLDSMRRRTETRFLIITHNPITMARVDRLFGVTMAERGVSTLVSVDLTTAQSVREAS